MPIFKIIIAVIVLALVVGGYLWYSGNLKVAEDGSVSVTAPKGPEVDPNADDYTKGTSFAAANDFDKGIFHLEKFIKENPTSPNVADARYKIAKCYDDRPNPDTAKALEAWREYKSKHPNDDTSRIKQAEKRIGLLSGKGVE